MTQVLAPPVAKRIQARHVICGDYIYVGPNNTDAILEAITDHMKHCPPKEAPNH